MEIITTSEARKDLRATLRRVQQNGRIALKRHDKIVGGIVSPRELRLLQLIEDAMDRKAARLAKEEDEREGSVPMDDFFAELGL